MGNIRWTASGVGLALILGLVGCSGSDAETPPARAPAEPTARAQSPSDHDGAAPGAAPARDLLPDPGGDVAACSPAILEMTRTQPLDSIGFGGTTATDAADVDVVARIADPDGTAVLELPLEVRPERRGRWRFLAPVHPFEPFAAYDMQVRLRADGDTCAEWTVHVTALTAAPGALEGLLEDTEAVLGHLARLLGVADAELMTGDASTLDPPALALRMMREAFDGDGHSGSAMARMRSLHSDRDDEMMHVLDAIVARSGLSGRARSLRVELQTLAGGVATPSSPDVVSAMTRAMLGIANAHANPPQGDGFLNPDAATLDRWMSATRTVELASGSERAQFYLDSANVLITIGGAGSAIASKLGNPKAAFFEGYFGTLAAATLTLDIGAELVGHLLPSRFVEMDMVADPTTYLEDDEDLSGRWHSARVVTRSRDWDATKATAQLALQMTSRRREGFVAEITDNPYLQNMISAMTDLLSSPWLEANLPGMQDDLGSIRFPARDFGPTDISDARWSERSQRSLTGEDVIGLTSHQGFEAVGIGRAELVVSTHPERFGYRGIQRAQIVDVSPISVRIDPAEATIEPGAILTLAASVTGANDDSVKWRVEPASAHRIEPLPRDGDGPHQARLYSSSDEDDFPARVSARSTSRSGLRRSGIPVREATTSLRAGGLQIEPRELCIEPGDEQRFTAFHFSQGIRQRVEDVSWQAQRGRIDGDGAYIAPGSSGSDRIEVHESADPGRSAVVELQVLDDCDCSWALTGGFGSHHGDTLSAQPGVGTLSMGSEISDRAPLISVGIGPFDAAGIYPLGDVGGRSDTRVVLGFPAPTSHQWFSIGSAVEITEFDDGRLQGRYAGRMARVASIEPQRLEYTDATLEFRMHRDPEWGALPGIWVCGPPED